MDQKLYVKVKRAAKTFSLYSVNTDVLEQYKDLFPEMNVNQELSALCTEYMQGKIDARKARKI